MRYRLTFSIPTSDWGKIETIPSFSSPITMCFLTSQDQVIHGFFRAQEAPDDLETWIGSDMKKGWQKISTENQGDWLRMEYAYPPGHHRTVLLGGARGSVKCYLSLNLPEEQWDAKQSEIDEILGSLAWVDEDGGEEVAQEPSPALSPFEQAGSIRALLRDRVRVPAPAMPGQPKQGGRKSGDPLAPLRRKPEDALTSGFYAMEDGITFNVLDHVVLDPKTSQVSLIGHRDDAYASPRIPYLQHLATLLEYPQPEFNLHWTPDSGKRVDAFLDRTHLPEEQARVGEKWGNFFDPNGQVTPVGRRMLPQLGLSPAPEGKAPGWLGTTVREAPDGAVDVATIASGSPAARAGLRIGDRILMGGPTGASMHPSVFDRNVLAAGAGAKFDLLVQRGGDSLNLSATLDAYPGDPWLKLDRHDYAEALLRADGKEQAAQVAHGLGMMNRLHGTPLYNTAGSLLDITLGLRGLQGLEYGRAYCAALDRTFEFSGTPTLDKFNSLLEQGMDKTNPGAVMPMVLGEFERQLKSQGALVAAFDKVLGTAGGIQIPPELIEEEYHLRPEVSPEYIHVDAHSQLARVMYDTDYTCKRLTNLPELAKKIPGYMTDFAFHNANPDKERKLEGTAEYHLWISVESLDLAVSKAGHTLETRGAKMRFNIRQFGAGHKDLPPIPGGYEELLTSQYEDFAKEYPVLHETSEIAKLAAAAKWIKAQKPGFKLPTRGRAAWNGPKTMPGLVYEYLRPQENGKAHCIILAEGGVSFVLPLEAFPPGNPEVVDLSNIPLTRLDLPIVPLGDVPGVQAEKTPEAPRVGPDGLDLGESLRDAPHDTKPSHVNPAIKTAADIPWSRAEYMPVAKANREAINICGQLFALDTDAPQVMYVDDFEARERKLNELLQVLDRMKTIDLARKDAGTALAQSRETLRGCIRRQFDLLGGMAADKAAMTGDEAGKESLRKRLEESRNNSSDPLEEYDGAQKVLSQAWDELLAWNPGKQAGKALTELKRRAGDQWEKAKREAADAFGMNSELNEANRAVEDAGAKAEKDRRLKADLDGRYGELVVQRDRLLKELNIVTSPPSPERPVP